MGINKRIDNIFFESCLPPYLYDFPKEFGLAPLDPSRFKSQYNATFTYTNKEKEPRVYKDITKASVWRLLTLMENYIDRIGGVSWGDTYYNGIFEYTCPHCGGEV